MRIGLLIPEFPQQTHVAWWRVGRAMSKLGAEVSMVSTRRPSAKLQCHASLIAASADTFYVWPPRWRGVIAEAVARPGSVIRGLRYVAGLTESTWKQKLRLLPLIPAAAGLKRWARGRGLDALFVHSCGDAAHLAALCRRMGGPRFALRLGGDPEVYGRDHRSKMGGAEFVAAAAPAYLPRLVEECGVSPERAFWTWAGVDTEMFSPAPVDRRRVRRPGEPLHVVTVARLTDTKGHADALEAIAALRGRGVDVRYTIAGRGPEEAAIRTAVDALGLGDRVTLAGALDQREVVELLWSADAFLLCSYGLGEGTPAVVSEAMACGVPVIATRIGGTPDMIDSGGDGLLVPQRDVAAVAAAIQSLATDEPTRRALAARALQSSERFDCLETARRVLAGFGYGAAPREPALDCAA